jgi:hypothetical protein
MDRLCGVRHGCKWRRANDLRQHGYLHRLGIGVLALAGDVQISSRIAEKLGVR